MSAPGAAPPAPGGPGPRAATVLVALLCLLWGSTWLVIRTGLEDLPPLRSAALRFTLAAAAMVLVARLLATREGGAAAPLWLTAVMGALNFAGSYGVVYWVEQTLPSALTSVLWAVYPLMMAVLGHRFLPGERIRPLGALGFLVGFLGVVLLFLTDVRQVGAGAIGAAFVLLVSPFIVAVATLLVKRHGAGVSSLRLNRDGMLLGAGLLWLAALLLERGQPARYSAAAVGSVLYLALVGTVVTFSIYFWLLRFAPAYKLAVIPYVTPMVAIVLGCFVGGEPVGAATLAGIGLILAGVVLVTRN